MLSYDEKFFKSKPLLEESDVSESEEDNENFFGSINDVSNETDYILKLNQPVDKYNLAYIIFYLLGMTTLMPWNFFITADSYWMYKFRDTHSKLIYPNMSLALTKRTPLQAEFTSYLSVASNIPSIAFLTLNVFLSKKIALQKRMLGSLTCMLILFVITTIFVNIDTDAWQQQFFIITIVIVVFLNASSAILCGSVFGIVGRFSPKYITAVVGGQALGGIFAALAQIVSLAFGASATHSAFVYFMVANCTLMVCLIAYLILSKSLFFKHNTKEQSGLESTTDYLPSTSMDFFSHKIIVKKIWSQGISIFLVFMVTLSVYPGITVLVESTDKGNGSKWNDIYFVPVVAYLLYSCGDYLGRISAGFFQWPKKGVSLTIFNICRIALVPLILLCNAHPRHSLPVLINKDYYYIIITAIFSFSNGYLANIPMINVSKTVLDEEKEHASSIVAVFVGLGLTVGAAINLVLVKII